jgi:hypothetical protein
MESRKRFPNRASSDLEGTWLRRVCAEQGPAQTRPICGLRTLAQPRRTGYIARLRAEFNELIVGAPSFEVLLSVA